MNELSNMIGQPECCEAPKPMDVAASINDKLSNKKRRLEAELAETNAAIEALEQHPDVAKVLTLVGRAIAGRY